MYGNTFKLGSTRRKVFQNGVRRAVKAGRIPKESLAVMEEIRKELHTYIWETSLQKIFRVEKEFERLEQGTMSHADFRALFESKLEDLKEAGIDVNRWDEQTLYRHYLYLSPFPTIHGTTHIPPVH